ncbi:MAG: hypothetical protein ABI304_11695 [Rudaea sp.]
MPATEYASDKACADNVVEITAAHGNVIEGRFNFHMKDSVGSVMTVCDGKFKAEAR